MWMVTGICSVILNLLILMIPIQKVLSLQMTWTRKFGVVRDRMVTGKVGIMSPRPNGDRQAARMPNIRPTCRDDVLIDK